MAKVWLAQTPSVSLLLERALEFGGVLDGGGRDGDEDGGASISGSDTANDGGWAVGGADGDAVVVLPTDDQKAAAPFDATTGRSCCGGCGATAAAGDEPGCYCYYCCGMSNSPPLPMAEVVSAVGLAEEALPHVDVFAVSTSTTAPAAARVVCAGGGAGGLAPLRALPVGGDALPPEARPPWELAAAFKLVACERVLPSPRRAAATPLRPSPTPSRKRKAAPPGGRRRGVGASCPTRGKASSVQWRGVSSARGQAGGRGGTGC
eukprot:g3786.t1